MDYQLPARLSTQQTKRIRSQLNWDFKGRNSVDPSFTWKQEAIRIETYTGVDMGVGNDRLRQFAKGISGLEDRRIKAIAEYLMHPDIKALEPSQLKQPLVPYISALPLAESFKHDETSEIVYPPLGLEGIYQAVDVLERTITERSLFMEVLKKSPFVYMREKSEVFSNNRRLDYDFKNNRARLELTQEPSESEGWGILTPEDNLLSFMKNIKTGRNHQYVFVDAMPAFTDELPIKHLAALSFNSCLGNVEVHDDARIWYEEVRRDFLSSGFRHFVRVGDIR